VYVFSYQTSAKLTSHAIGYVIMRSAS